MRGSCGWARAVQVLSTTGLIYGCHQFSIKVWDRLSIVKAGWLSRILVAIMLSVYKRGHKYY